MNLLFTKLAGIRSNARFWTVRTPRCNGAFTLIEILVAIAILGLVCATIFSTWTAILRASQTGLEAAAVAQRARSVSRIIEEALGSAQSYSANLRWYSFVAENGSEGSLSFVSRLHESFPRSRKFGDLNLRRVEFSVNSRRELVLRQCPLLMAYDEDEIHHPVVLARNVNEFKAEFWDQRDADWIDEWTATNTMPPLVRITLSLANNEQSREVSERIVRVVSLPATAVGAQWQRQVAPPTPTTPGAPGTPGTPGAPVRPGVPGQPGIPAQPGLPGQQFPGLVLPKP
jgi:prepilin-type N-terminal cleavage/methylation domain-containing protein